MKQISINQFTDYTFLSSIKWSPCGQKAYAYKHRACDQENKYVTDLISIDLAKGTSSLVKNKDFTDYYLDGNHPIYAYANHEGSRVVIGDEEYCLLPDKVNKLIHVNDEFVLYQTSMDFSLGQSNESYSVFEEIPCWQNGKGYHHVRNIIKKYYVNENRVAFISTIEEHVLSCHYDSSTDSLVAITSPFKGVLRQETLLKIYHNGVSRLVNNAQGLVMSYACFVDEDTLLVAASDCKTFGENENHKIYRLSLNKEDNQWTNLTPQNDKSLWNTVVSDARFGGVDTFKCIDGKLYFITTEKCSSYLNAIDQEGNLKKVTFCKGSIDSYDVKGQEIVTIAMHDYRLQECYLMKDKSYQKVTSFNEELSKGFIKPQAINYTYDDGLVINGWVIKPKSASARDKKPAILMIHGGPKSAYGSVSNHELQYLVDQGYGILYCNPRGSNGRGDAFSDIRGKFATIDFDDLINFTKEVVKQHDWIDENRLGVAGGSYGGYMTNMIVGRSKLFKAAVSQRCISNWITMYGMSDIGYFWTEYQNGATPWENPEKLWEHSPLKYANDITTPLLLIHSEEDYRCHYVESVQMFTAVKKNHVPSRLCLIKNENHELSRSGKPKERVIRLKEIENWFNKYL